MQKVKIAGKEYEVQATYGHFQKLVRKYPDMDKMPEWKISKYDAFIFDAVWMMMKMRFCINPLIFKRRMKNITIPELNVLRETINKVILGEKTEDEELG